MILTDTSVWVDFFRGRGSARILHRLIEQEESLCLTGIHLTEILQGIKEDRVHEQIQVLSSFLCEFLKPGEGARDLPQGRLLPSQFHFQRNKSQ